MGAIKHMLGARKVTPYSGYGHFVMEAAEDIHIHWRDTKLQLHPEDFDNLKKYVVEAHNEWTKLGRPRQDDKNINLGSPFKCKEPGLYCSKMTVEEQETGGIHIHWRDTRIQADHGHYSSFSTMINEAYLAFKEIHKEKVKLNELEHPAVADGYLIWLQEYREGKHGKVDADDCTKICMEKHKYLANNITIPDELDKKVLFSIYESFIKYGYASGPFYGNYIICWLRDDGKKYMAAAHRWASLKTLGYDEIDVCTIPKPDPIQIREQ